MSVYPPHIPSFSARDDPWRGRSRMATDARGTYGSSDALDTTHSDSRCFSLKPVGRISSAKKQFPSLEKVRLTNFAHTGYKKLSMLSEAFTHHIDRGKWKTEP